MIRMMLRKAEWCQEKLLFHHHLHWKEEILSLPSSLKTLKLSNVSSYLSLILSQVWSMIYINTITATAINSTYLSIYTTYLSILSLSLSLSLTFSLYLFRILSLSHTFSLCLCHSLCLLNFLSVSSFLSLCLFLSVSLSTL